VLNAAKVDAASDDMWKVITQQVCATQVAIDHCKHLNISFNGCIPDKPGLAYSAQY